MAVRAIPASGVVSAADTCFSPPGDAHSTEQVSKGAANTAQTMPARREPNGEGPVRSARRPGPLEARAAAACLRGRRCRR